MVSRHNVDSLEDLATYLKEGIVNRQRTLREIELRHGNGPDGDVNETLRLDEPRRAAELHGEMRAFAKVLQILDEQFNVT